MNDFLFGVAFGLIIVIFVGYLDTVWLGKPTIKMINVQPITVYAMATAWELLFFVCGFVFGYLVLR